MSGLRWLRTRIRARDRVRNPGFFRSRGPLLLLFALPCALAFWMRWAATRAEARPDLVVSQSALEMGDVWAQRDFRWTLPIHNTTAGDIEIVEFRTSCGCMVIEPSKLTVPGGQCVVACVQLDLEDRGEKADAAPAEVTTTVAAITRESLPGAFRWQLYARVHPHPVVALPNRVDFGESLVRGSPFTKRVIALHCREPVEAIRADCPGALGKVEILGRHDSKDYELIIQPDPRMEVGEHRFEVSVVPFLTRRRGGRDVPPLAIPVIARVCTDVYATPSAVCLGAAKTGEILEQTLLLSSRTNRPFVLLKVEQEAGPSVDVDNLGVAERTRRSLRVRQRIGEVGSRGALLQFVVQEEGNTEPYRVPLMLSYHGLPR